MTLAAGIDGGDYMSNMDLPPSSSDEEASNDSELECEQAVPRQHDAATAPQMDDEPAFTSASEQQLSQSSCSTGRNREGRYSETFTDVDGDAPAILQPSRQNSQEVYHGGPAQGSDADKIMLPNSRPILSSDLNKTYGLAALEAALAHTHLS